VNGELSTLKYLKYGVLQGSIWDPLLFLIYINDLLNCLQHSTARMFADDTNITVSGKSIEAAVVQSRIFGMQRHSRPSPHVHSDIQFLSGMQMVIQFSHKISLKNHTKLKLYGVETKFRELIKEIRKKTKTNNKI
jgi:hypothetical protein